MIMKDELKNYIQSHKNQFDDHSINEVDKLALWEKISEQLPETPKKGIPLWKKASFRVAAAIVLLFGCLFLYFNTNKTAGEYDMVSDEFRQIDTHYKSLVQNQIQLVKTSANLSKQEQEAFLSHIDTLDKEYIKLKKELKQGVNNQLIIEAIINNYRKKIQLMEDLLRRSYPVQNTADDGELIL
ncbi:hypothetical protein KAOT1_16818 [Kordia algicida OT-1]|uniref:Anti-sigma factor n=2 Tax=Kordia TaxID=221065 RepID=A9DRU7_9FLAO|nr:hypothetical protein KAOT1_16818 [Kordia algicida OT-1]